MTETELAYIAAAIDGEGCISFKTRKTSKTPWLFDIRICITNTNKPWLSWLQKLLGGSLSTNCKPKPRRKQGYRLQIDGHKRCQEVLRSVLPYLRIKQRQAKLALKYQPIAAKLYSNRWHKTTISKALSRKRAGWFFRMKKLNQRGIPS